MVLNGKFSKRRTTVGTDMELLRVPSERGVSSDIYKQLLWLAAGWMSERSPTEQEQQLIAD